MRMRGRARTPGRICKADVLRDAFGWRLSVVVETDCAERPPATGPAAGLQPPTPVPDDGMPGQAPPIGRRPAHRWPPPCSG